MSIELQGKYGSAIIFNDEVEASAISQVYTLLNHVISENSHSRFMPDIHTGKGCTIGYTAILGDKVVPNLIGVDKGCGVLTVKLGKLSDIGEKFDKLDRAIRDRVPSGMSVRDRKSEDLEFIFRQGLKTQFHNYRDFEDAVKEVCKRQSQNFDRVMNSIGTLGGGNHFIEVGKDEDNCLRLPFILVRETLAK